MNIKQTMRNLVLGGLLIFGVAAIFTPSVSADCGDVPTAIINCEETDKDGDGATDANETGLWAVLVLTINILTAGVGVLALAGLVYGAVMYTSAGGSPEQVKKAMDIFRNVVIGIVAFAGMWALLNFLIPGGVFNSL